MSGYVEKKRYKWAFRMGRQEHRFSHLTGVILIFGAIFIGLFPDTFTSEIGGWYVWQIMWFVCAFLWVLYAISHRMEKKFFPGARRKKK